MANERKRLYVIMCALAVAVVALSIAYAALSATLNIGVSSVQQTPQTWNVAFEAGTVTGTAAGTSAVGRSCGTATVNATTASIAATELSKPGDKCTYALTIKNTGSINATLASITPTQPTGTGVSCGTASGAQMVCGNITYTLAKYICMACAPYFNTSGSLLPTGGTLAASTGTLPVYLIAEYTGETLAGTEIVQSNAGFTLVYNQA